jgi:hypothetical protein
VARTRQKPSKKSKIKGNSQDKSLLLYLDDRIEKFYQANKNYPATIILSKEANDKIFEELALETDLSNSWYDKKDNYKNIKFSIQKVEGIELK